MYFSLYKSFPSFVTGRLESKFKIYEFHIIIRIICIFIKIIEFSRVYKLYALSVASKDIVTKQIKNHKISSYFQAKIKHFYSISFFISIYNVQFNF